MDSVTLAACQPPYIQRSPEKALELIAQYSLEAERSDAEMVCFPECFLQGYEIGSHTSSLAIDLSSADFKNILKQLEMIEPMIIFGLIEKEGASVFNTAVVIQRGALLGKYRKSNLIGAEKKVFVPGDSFPVFGIDKVKFGINICYDTNFSSCAKAVSDQGAKLLVCLSNNMLERSTAEKWKNEHNPIRSKRAVESGVWLVSSDVTGEMDGRISYGPTAVINPSGEVVQQLPLLEPGLLVHEIIFKTQHTIDGDQRTRR